MSYDVQFAVDGQVVRLDHKHQIAGGTYAVGGTDLAEMNITYNYCPHFDAALGAGGLRSLYGKTAREIAESLPRAIMALGGPVRDPDYWKATPGNAAAALYDLLALATMCPPDAVLEGD